MGGPDMKVGMRFEGAIGVGDYLLGLARTAIPGVVSEVWIEMTAGAEATGFEVDVEGVLSGPEMVIGAGSGRVRQRFHPGVALGAGEVARVKCVRAAAEPEERGGRVIAVVRVGR